MKHPYGNPATLEGYKEYWLKVIKEYRDDGDELKLSQLERNFNQGAVVAGHFIPNISFYYSLTSDGCEQLAILEAELEKLREMFEELTEACNVDN